MKRCKTCKSWFRSTKAPVHKRDVQGKCDHPKLSDDTSLDGATDGEGYSGIYTGPDFGCVHHEEKEGVEGNRPLQTLEDFDKARFAQRPVRGPNGIACPKCDAELWDAGPALLPTSPAQVNIHCEGCGYRGTRYE